VLNSEIYTEFFYQAKNKTAARIPGNPVVEVSW
jgi:hypothetical protein